MDRSRRMRQDARSFSGGRVGGGVDYKESPYFKGVDGGQFPRGARRV